MTVKKKESAYDVKNKTKNAPKEKEGKTIVTVKAESLSLFVGVIKDCITNAILNIEDTRMFVSTVDNANVYMILAECECKTIFEDSCSPKRVGVDSGVFEKALIHSKGCSVTLTITETSIEATYGRSTATFPATDICFIRKEPKSPTLNLGTTLSIPGKYLWESSTSVSKQGRMVIYVKDKVAFLETYDGDLTIKEVVGTVDKKSNARSMYSNDYIRAIISRVRDVDLTVSIDVDRPAKMHAEKNGCKFDFLLAPRIEAD